jgi:Protein of unknown function (DUF2680)
MKLKKWVVAILVIAMALMAVSVGFAAVQKNRVKDFEPLQQQMLNIHKQILQKHVEYGDLTAEQAAVMEKHMTERYESMKANEFKPGFGPGVGRMGGRMGHIGGSCPNWQGTPTQQQSAVQ